MLTRTKIMLSMVLPLVGMSCGIFEYLQHTPDWKPVIWHLSEFRYAGSWWGESLPETFFTYGTPPIEVAAPVEA
jgi:hypothetical protein